MDALKTEFLKKYPEAKDYAVEAAVFR